jgi:serine/threonine protein kinase
MSPELHNPDEDGRPPPFDIGSDIWAFGMVMLEASAVGPHWYFLLTSDYKIQTCNIPWIHLISDSAVMLGVIRGNVPPPPKNVTIRPALWALMQECWKYNPSERVSMQDLMARIDLMRFQRDVQDPSKS